MGRQGEKRRDDYGGNLLVLPGVHHTDDVRVCGFHLWIAPLGGLLSLPIPTFHSIRDPHYGPAPKDGFSIRQRNSEASGAHGYWPRLPVQAEGIQQGTDGLSQESSLLACSTCDVSLSSTALSLLGCLPSSLHYFPPNISEGKKTVRVMVWFRKLWKVPAEDSTRQESVQLSAWFWFEWGKKGVQIIHS